MAATGKIVTLNGYIYKSKNQKEAKYPFKFVSPNETESVIELVVMNDDLATCEKLVWEEVEIQGESQANLSFKLLSIAPVGMQKKFAG